LRSHPSLLPPVSGLVMIAPNPLVAGLRYDSRTQERPVPDMGEITELLHKWRDGDREAENELFALVLPDLRRLAHYLMKGERKGHTLQPTELVDQIYFRLVSAKNRDWHNRQHFFAIAGRAMRRYLIDHARGRPNAEFVAIEGMENLIPGDSAKVNLALTVDGLLDKLAATKPEWCTLVEVKYFLGLTDEEAADALGMKLRTMQRTWLEARKWLFEQMESGSATQSA
jgi:RNA polymerase sigma-70 factor, ECF subfamily